MKPAQAKAIIDDCIKRGWIMYNGTLYTPKQAQDLGLDSKMMSSTKKNKSVLNRLKIASNKTGWIDDSRNLKNKERIDNFVRLVKLELGLELWPEFHFKSDRLWRFDYAVPVTNDGKILKIAIECEGGVWNNGRHTRGKGFIGDMEKYNEAAADRWTLIRRTPDNLCTSETIDLIIKSVDSILKFMH